jgi:SAM-dependent methyltransferase
MDSAYADFAGPEITFDDWWTQSPEKMRKWLDEEAPREEEFEVGLTRRFLAPMLQRLGYLPGQASLLSAGCGLASDVDFLNDSGYSTWGIDCGNRVLRWSERRYRAQLARADLLLLPFPDEAFDFVLSLNTLEHIGVVGDSTTVTSDYQEQRTSALHALLRVLKPGGHLLLSGLSRTIPFDFGHVQQSRFVRVHSPWERFLLNYSDVRQLCLATGCVDWTQPLPLRGFFSWTRLRHYRLAWLVLPFVDWLFGSLPNAVYGSWVSPLWVALVHKRAAPAQSDLLSRGGKHGAIESRSSKFIR